MESGECVDITRELTITFSDTLGTQEWWFMEWNISMVDWELNIALL